MKTKVYLISILFSFFLLSGFSLMAQDLVEKPPVSDEGTYYKETPLAKHLAPKSVNPQIADYISQVNSDSVRAVIQGLQDFGTRYMLNDNRKEVATWIMQKFLSYGYTNVELDSFLTYYVDTLWQYNVVCTLSGSSAPEEVYVVGGHYDSWTTTDPASYAPGANDNATAVAATVEIARIMKKNNYQPESTIKFMLYAAEERGLFGSFYHAQKARETGEDVRYVLNMDMISNNPDTVKEVKVYRYLYFEWAGNLMAEMFSRYTDLEAFIPANQVQGGSDALPYWIFGFPVSYLEERIFSPHWHLNSDTVGNCNIDYCAEITRGAFATLMDQQLLPVPPGIRAESRKTGITLSWRPTANERVTGYNIYRSDEPGTGYEKINPELVSDTAYEDISIAGGKIYYYIAKSVNDSVQESFPSNEVNGARFTFSDSLLVVSCLKGDKITPDSVFNYYQAVLDTIPFVWKDINANQTIDIGILSRYRSILWLLNTAEFEYPDESMAPGIFAFFENGGNMMFSGFVPSRYFSNNSTYPSKFHEESFMRTHFKADSVDKKMICFLYGANPEGTGYDTIRIDPLKTTYPQFPGAINNIEAFTPTSEADVIYRFYSPSPDSTTYGAMNGKPVGLEYMGTDFKTILLSFPLWYLDTADARALMGYVMKNKFTHPVGIDEPGTAGNGIVLQSYPNPFSDKTTVTFLLPNAAEVNLSVYNLQGVRVSTLIHQRLEEGLYSYPVMAGNMPSGLYQVVLKTANSITSRKIVLIR